MTDNQIKIDFRFVNKDELSHQNGLISHFETNTNSNKILVDYKYKGEPNNNRIQLELSGEINGKSIISSHGINENIELPYQYPKRFELSDSKGDFIAIPHNQGVYILRADSNDKYLIKYQTKKFLTCFFVGDLFLLVEEKGFKIVYLADFTERFVLFENKLKIFINALQVIENQVYAIIQDVEINQMKLFVFDKQVCSFDNYSEYNLADLIESKHLSESLKYEKETKLAGIPVFHYNSLIDSWRFVANNKWNSLIGRIEDWLKPEKHGEYFIRKERYDYIELEIKTFANK